MEALATVKAFVKGIKPNDQRMLEALAITATEAVVLFEGLKAAAKDDGLAMPGFIQLAGKKVLHPSPYINKLRHKGFVEHGDERGKWRLTKSTNEKLRALVGETSPTNAVKVAQATSEPEAGVIDVVEAQDQGQSVPDDPFTRALEGATLNTISAYVDRRLNAIDRDIEAIQRGCDEQMAAIQRERDEQIDRLKAEREGFEAFITKRAGEIK